MIHKIDMVENALIVCGVTLSLTQLYTILGIVLLSVQICLIIAKCIIKIVQAVKKNNLEDAVSSIEDAQKEIDDRTSTVKSIEEDHKTEN